MLPGKQAGCKVTCIKIDLAQSQYSSFKVPEESDDVRDVYAPDLWPEGALVWRFYEMHQSKEAVVTGVSQKNASGM